MQSDTSLVAVVDDEESVRKALARLIRTAGYEVETFGSGVEFMLSLQRRKPHCVVLDLRMPVVDGFEIQRALSQSRAHVPVVIITGDDSPENRAKTESYGAHAYLHKPVDDAMLLDAIQNAVRAAQGMS
jgi:FixJ family two-component response regulator